MPKINKIKDVHAREVLDSRGNPTVEAKVFLDGGIVGVAKVPSGASTGSHEALELRDGDPKRYRGKGVLKAVSNVNGPIKKEISGIDVCRQRDIDERMIKLDGTDNKSKLGANAILSVSLACAKAGALAKQMPFYRYIREVYELPYKEYHLPVATMNVLNGGKHAAWSLDFQEFMIIPQAPTFKERVRKGAEVFYSLADILKKEGHSVAVGDEGGYAPRLKKNENAFKTIMKAVEDAGYKGQKDIQLGMDVAASEFFNIKANRYEMVVEKKKYSSEKLIELYADWIKKYPITLIEDGLAEDDWSGWQKMNEVLGKDIVLVGDDIFVTNVERIKKGIEMGVANSVLIKVNQIGSLTETIDAVLLAKENNYSTVISHRSGSTCDTTIADLSVAVNSEYIKTGSLSRSERVVKYNRLMEIEDELGK